jgi:hypothetical protein
MQRHIQLLLTGLAATAMLAAAIGTATAKRLSITNPHIRVVWRSLELSNSISTNVVRCAVTLEGSFHSRTIVKSRELLIGYVTKANVQNNQCTGGRVTVLSETLPWHLTYQSFRGTLPRITEILLNLIGAGLDIEITGVNNCKVITSITNPARVIANIEPVSGEIVSLRADSNARIPLTNAAGGFACGLGSGNFNGIGTVSLVGTNNLIFILLI